MDTRTPPGTAFYEQRQSGANARTHSEVQIAQIAGSIAEFGFVNPELVDDDEVIAGRGRVLAARTLGLSSRRLAKQSHAIYQCT